MKFFDFVLGEPMYVSHRKVANEDQGNIRAKDMWPYFLVRRTFLFAFTILEMIIGTINKLLRMRFTLLIFFRVFRI